MSIRFAIRMSSSILILANFPETGRLIAHLMARSKPVLHKGVSTTVRELSVSLQGAGNGKTIKVPVERP